MHQASIDVSAELVLTWSLDEPLPSSVRLMPELISWGLHDKGLSFVPAMGWRLSSSRTDHLPQTVCRGGGLLQWPLTAWQVLLLSL